MVAFRQEPYLWLHLTGLALVPLLLDICLAGLATADPILPVGLEMALLGLVGTVPILWLQWQRPFYIFSVGVVMLEPAVLNPTQRRILSLMRSQWVRITTLVGAAGLLLVLWQLYRIAPMAAAVTPFAGLSRLGGLAIAAIAFLAANLFTQVPLTVLRVLWANPADFQTVSPYVVERVKSDFWAMGVRVRRLLPELAAPALSAATAASMASPVAAASQPESSDSAGSSTDEAVSPYEEPELEDLWD
ncbi:MAG: low-complexity tail membrane protein [Cyanobacteria bacterium P01_A01_bin.114]